MTTTRTWYHRLSQWWPKESSPDELVQMGIVVIGSEAVLVHPETPVRGVKLVTLPASLLRRYEKALAESSLVQTELSKYKVSLRPRRKPAAKVEISDLNEATQSTETSA